MTWVLVLLLTIRAETLSIVHPGYATEAVCREAALETLRLLRRQRGTGTWICVQAEELPPGLGSF